MIRKSAREITPQLHTEIGARLAVVDSEVKAIIATLHGSKKAGNLAVKTAFWVGRLRVALDNLLLHDHPSSYSAAVYFPRAAEAQPKAEVAKGAR